MINFRLLYGLIPIQGRKAERYKPKGKGRSKEEERRREERDLNM